MFYDPMFYDPNELLASLLWVMLKLCWMLF